MILIFLKLCEGEASDQREYRRPNNASGMQHRWPGAIDDMAAQSVADILTNTTTQARDCPNRGAAKW
jgi:hypothetical protein